MKVSRYLIVLFVMVQAVMFTTVAKAGIANPIGIINGGSMSYTTNSNNNWYSFTMKSAGYVLVFGDSDCSTRTEYTVYNENLDRIYSERFCDRSIHLSAGKYKMQVVRAQAGTFTVFSWEMNSPENSNPAKGTILNPHIPLNGVNIAVGSDVEKNVYFFEMRAAGNIVYDGPGTCNVRIEFDIYTENLETVHRERFCDSPTYLYMGKHYLVAKGYQAGSMNIYSPNLVANPTPSPVNPDNGDVAFLPAVYLLLL